MAKTPIKALLENGLAALCNHIKTYAEYTANLGNQTAEGFQQANSILSEKLDVSPAVNFTIPVDGWERDSTFPGYFYYDFPISGLLDTDIVDVTVLPDFCEVAGAAGFIVTESLTGKLRLRAANIPTAAIKAQYHITNTVKYTDTQEGGT